MKKTVSIILFVALVFSIFIITSCSKEEPPVKTETSTPAPTENPTTDTKSTQKEIDFASVVSEALAVLKKSSPSEDVEVLLKKASEAISSGMIDFTSLPLGLHVQYISSDDVIIVAGDRFDKAYGLSTQTTGTMISGILPVNTLPVIPTEDQIKTEIEKIQITSNTESEILTFEFDFTAEEATAMIKNLIGIESELTNFSGSAHVAFKFSSDDHRLLSAEVNQVENEKEISRLPAEAAPILENDEITGYTVDGEIVKRETRTTFDISYEGDSISKFEAKTNRSGFEEFVRGEVKREPALQKTTVTIQTGKPESEYQEYVLVYDEANRTVTFDKYKIVYEIRDDSVCCTITVGDIEYGTITIAKEKKDVLEYEKFENLSEDEQIKFYLGFFGSLTSQDGDDFENSTTVEDEPPMELEDGDPYMVTDHPDGI